MTDKNGKDVKVGDYVLFDPRLDNKNFAICRVHEIDISLEGTLKDSVILPYKNARIPWHRNGCEIEKLTDEEALIWIMENE